MPVKRLRQPKKVRENLTETAGIKVRQTRSEAAETTRTVDGKRVMSLIPVVRRRGRPSLASKFNPTVDITEALKGLGKGFFIGEEKDLFRTPLKGRPAEGQKQRQSAAGLRSPPTWSNKRGAGQLGSSSHGSPGSEASSDSPYFLRSKGSVDAVVDDSLLHPKLMRKSGGLASAEKESPVRKGRKSVQSPPHKKTEPEKSPVLIKAARASSSGRKYDSQENSILDKQTVEGVKRDAAKPTAFIRTTSKSRRQTKTSRNPNSEEFANVAEKSVQVETGKKRKREQDEIDDLMTKRAKVVIVDAGKKLEMVQEPNQKLTSKLLVLRANDEDISDKVVLKSEGERASLGPAEEKNRVQKKHGIQTSAEKEISKTKQKSAAQVASVVTGNHSTPSQKGGPVFESVDSRALVGNVQSLSDASADLDEIARKKLNNLTADISVRGSWSAHLYDRGDVPVSKVPRLSVAANSQPKSMDMRRLLSTVTPSVDFHVNWDTSAVKDQLLSSLRPQKTLADELTTVPHLMMAKEVISQPSSKRLLEESKVVLTNSFASPLRRPDIDKPVFDRDVLEFGENVPSEVSAVVLTNSVASPLRRPDIDKPVFDRDVLEFGETVPLPLSRKTVCIEEERETRRRPSSRLNTATPFTMPVQQLKVNDAGLRRSVDRLMPTVDRENVVRGRSLEPGMIQGEAIHRQPKFNGQLATQELKPVNRMGRGRGSRVFRRLLCLVGTPVLVVGCGYLVHLALAAGYLGDFF